jgi:hypothetical protein
MAMTSHCGYDMAKGMFHFRRYIRIKFSGESQVFGGVAYGIMAQIRFKYRQVGG